LEGCGYVGNLTEDAMTSVLRGACATLARIAPQTVEEEPA
jgi:hypothetical protein